MKSIHHRQELTFEEDAGSDRAIVTKRLRRDFENDRTSISLDPFTTWTGLESLEYPGMAERALPAELECAYQLLTWLLPTGGGCNIIEWIIDYAREFEGKHCATLRGHTDQVTSLAPLHGGSRIASGSKDLTIRIWSVETSKCLLILTGHDGMVNSLTGLYDEQLASGSSDSTVRIWDTVSGGCSLAMRGHNAVVSALATLPDSLLASGSWDKTVRLWNTTTGACLRTLIGHSYAVTSLVVLSNGHLVSGSWDNTVRIWDPATGECICTLEQDSNVYSLVALPDCKFVVGTYEGSVRVCDYNTGVSTLAMQGVNIVWALALLSDGRIVLSHNCTVRIWDRSTGVYAQTLGGAAHHIKLISLPTGGLATCGILLNDYTDTVCNVHIWK